MSEGDLIQQSQLPPREAPGGSAQAASVSDDNEFSVAETQRLQGCVVAFDAGAARRGTQPPRLGGV